MDKLNQELLLFLSVQNLEKEMHGIEQKLNFHIEISGRNGEDHDWETVSKSDWHTRTIKCVQVNRNMEIFINSIRAKNIATT
jgi:hypothetical protein